MNGKLYVIGIGPGDPELLTLKAARILNDVPLLLVPKGREEGTSLALSIIDGAVNLHGKEIVELYFPMLKTKREQAQAQAGAEDQAGGDLATLDQKWHSAAETILSALQSGHDAAFITIGDPSIYSTYFYIHELLLAKVADLAIEIIPGISSINASAARAGLSLGLGNERIAILPANYLASLEETLERFDTVLLMKVNKVFETVRNLLIDLRLAETAVYIARTGMADERIIRDLRQVRPEDLTYFSLVIVKKRPAVGS